MPLRRPLLTLLCLLLAATGVLSTPAPPASAAFPGDSGRIVFEREGKILTSTAGGNDIKVLVRTGYNLNPNWSADGKLIVWSAYGAEDVIWVMRADGSNKRRVYTGEHAFPSFTPDGRILFELGDPRSTSGHIHTIRLDGTGLRKLVPDLPDHVGDGAMSPNGRWVAFTHYRARNSDGRILDTDVYVAHPDGSGLRKIFPDVAYDSEWSPDGRHVAVHAEDGIYTIRMSDGRIRQLTTKEGDGEPAWSPDGRRIAFQRISGAAGNYNIFVMAADGSNERPLIASAKYETTPSWQPRP